MSEDKFLEKKEKVLKRVIKRKNLHGVAILYSPLIKMRLIQ